MTLHEFICNKYVVALNLIKICFCLFNFGNLIGFCKKYLENVLILYFFEIKCVPYTDACFIKMRM